MDARRMERAIAGLLEAAEDRAVADCLSGVAAGHRGVLGAGPGMVAGAVPAAIFALRVGLALHAGAARGRRLIVVDGDAGRALLDPGGTAAWDLRVIGIMDPSKPAPVRGLTCPADARGLLPNDAEGVVASRLTLPERGGRRGLTIVACPTGGAPEWFLGPALPRLGTEIQCGIDALDAGPRAGTAEREAVLRQEVARAAAAAIWSAVAIVVGGGAEDLAALLREGTPAFRLAGRSAPDPMGREWAAWSYLAAEERALGALLAATLARGPF